MAERSPGSQSSGSSSDDEDTKVSNQPDYVDHHFDSASGSLGNTYLLRNGIQFTLQNTTKLQSFTYATLPGIPPTALDSKICCKSDSDDIGGEYVVFYKLANAEESLKDVTKKCCKHEDDCVTVGLIIGNTESNIVLPSRVLKEGKPKWPPIYIVSLEDGEQIEALLNQYTDVEDLQVKVLAESENDLNYSKSSQPRTPVDDEFVHVSMENSEPVSYHLYDQLKRHLYKKKERIPVVVRPKEFQFAFSCFENYELQPVRDSHDKAIKKLDNFKEDIFSKDFLFYLLVAHRFSTYKSYYKNSDQVISNYIHHCIEKFENLNDLRGIADNLHSFVERGDFDIQWSHRRGPNLSVYSLLHQMANSMLKKSITLHEMEKYFKASTVYQRILWISLSIFFGVHRNVDPATLSNMWSSELFSEKVLGKQGFSDEAVAGFKKGFQFLEYLKLPEKALFDSNCFAVALNPMSVKGVHCSHIMELTKAGTSHLKWEVEFFCCFLPIIRNHYEILLKKQKEEHNFLWDGYSDDDTKIGVYREIVSFLEFVVSFVSDNSENKSEMAETIDVEIYKYLHILQIHVDLRAGKAVHFFKELRKSKLLLAKHSKLLTTEINERTIASMEQLSLHQIYELFKGLRLWKYAFVEEFLKNHPLPEQIDLKNPIWRNLLSEIISRFSSANCKKLVIDLMKRISEGYVNDGKQDKFLMDLVELDVPKLVYVQTADSEVEVLFIEMICSFIRRNIPQKDLIEMSLEIVDLVKPGNDLHRVLLIAIQKEIVSDATMLKNISHEGLKQMIVKSVDFASKIITTLSHLSTVDQFFWSFIASCCNHIKLTAKDLCKFGDYSFTIEHLCKIYSTHCKKVTKKSAQFLCEIPDSIKTVSNKDVINYFKWICKMQSIFIEWHRKFKNEENSFDDILDYISSMKIINKFAQLLNVSKYLYEPDKMKDFKEHFLSTHSKLCAFLVKETKDCDKCITLVQMLSDYGIKLSHTLHQEIETHVVLPGEKLPQNFQKTPNVPLYSPEATMFLKKSATLNILSRLLNGLEKFLWPVLKKIDVFVYFSLRDCEVFSRYLKCQVATMSTSALDIPVDDSDVEVIIPSAGNEESVDNSDNTIMQFAVALDKTEKFILSMMKGTATYDDIKPLLSDELLPKWDIDYEFKIMSGFPGFQDIVTEGKEGIKNMFELFQFSQQISSIPKVCEQYHLANCLNDPKLKELEEIINSVKNVEDKAKITGQVASRHMRKIWEVLQFGEDHSKAKRCLKIFPAVAKCAEFYQFIKGRGFTSEATSRYAFRTQVELITAQLQHEDYNERILNHLIPAFHYIVPFLDAEQNLTELLEKIIGLLTDGVGFGRDPKDDFCQLETVSSNITMIQLWFSRTEGDTLENVSNELKCIMSTGYFKLVIIHKQKRITEALQVDIDVTDKCSSEVLLHYELTGVEHESFKNENSDETSSGTQQQSSVLTAKWNSEQIDDFVRKLGFIEDQNIEKPIKSFQQLNQTALNLFHTMLELRDLGHPDYLERSEKLLCNTNIEDAKQKVNDAQNILVEWKSTIRDLYKKYDKLMFFSMSKVLLLNNSLKLSSEKVMQEIGFLFKNDKDVTKRLRGAVKQSSITMKEMTDVEASISTVAPVAYVGKYLKHLCEDAAVSKDFLFNRSQLPAGEELSTYQEVVHYAPDYTNEKLLLLLIEIYNGVPESYEVFHCTEDSTEEDLKLFLDRASNYRKHTFTALEVNKLPYKLQELIFHHRSHEVKEMTSATRLNYIETSVSILHEMPWVTLKEYQSEGPSVTLNEAKLKCTNLVNNRNINFKLKLVYGCAGDGKTHYIKKHLSDPSLIIAVNESFTVLNTICKLRTLPSDKSCAIFFNMTVLPSANTAEISEGQEKTERLINTLAWFFFKLLIYGYVEDLKTGMAFRLPGGLSWKLFVEIPSDEQENPQHSLEWFCNKIPIFKIVGEPYLIQKQSAYEIDSDVQLVCKYLVAYEHRHNLIDGINRLCNDKKKKKRLVKFGEDKNCSERECLQLLNKHMPAHVTKSKVLQQLFIRYMERRCKFLENFPAFNYNLGTGEKFDDKSIDNPDELKKMVADKILHEIDGVYYSNTSKLGETLMKRMLEEVSEFCKIDAQQKWTSQIHQQLIYEESGTIQLLTLKPQGESQEEDLKLRFLGIRVPSAKQLLSRETLDLYLSSALGVPLNEVKRLQEIDDENYVLTLDYTLKMLNIHERRECGVPVIIEGETGVGKTALINMLSILWNHALIDEWRKVKGRIIQELYTKSHELEDPDLKNSLEELNSHGWHSDKQSHHHHRCLKEDDLIPLLEYTSQDGGLPYCKFVNKYLLQLINTAPILELIEVNVEAPLSQIQNASVVGDGNDSLAAKLIKQADKDSSPQSTANVLCTLLNGTLIPTFYKLNIHAALTPRKIREFFSPICKLALDLQKKAEKFKSLQKPPLLTVFMDELNTSSCMGLFKEMIVDKSFEGEPLPSNIFLVAACNPHRGNSLAVHEAETWAKGSYYVQKLHPTLRFLMWDYRSLSSEQESDYIKAKMTMVNTDLKKIQNIEFTQVVVSCQDLIRKYAHEQLKALGYDDEEELKFRAASCVSQRDIQRVFTFYSWINKTYENFIKLNKEKKEPDPYITSHPIITKQCLNQYEIKQRALLVALGLVYYMRLNTHYRKVFINELEKLIPNCNVKFKEAFNDEMTYYIDNLSLPTGIAKTEALKENLFATIICTVTNTPLIIVGAPGSSKTLSFNLTVSNLKGPESKEILFRNTEVFKSLDPHYYQCSRRTTSTEIETVFHHAINRQRSHNNFFMPIRCVMFMDEAGLPEESHESLKVLHYHLDQREVAFVGITNHVLDAAKTNRAVSLFRPVASPEDLKTLAEGCLCTDPDNPPAQQLATIVKFCPAYSELIKDKRFKNFYGLRDFIHFINYIRRKKKGQGHLEKQLVLQSLERNFNGTEYFDYICELFLEKMDNDMKTSQSLKERTIIEILRDSLDDKTYSDQSKHDKSLDDTQNEVRYKLIIDPSEDESIPRLLFMFGILKCDNTRIFMCSNFPGDNQLQKINTIAAIRHSATEGHTVIMSQTDDIHESFYDLFNQHFRRIDDPEHGPRYFTNIAIGAHTKPSRVDQKFQCIVVIKESDIKHTPAPFFNRFEKYFISHKTLLDLVLDDLPPWLKIIADNAHKKVTEFYSMLEKSTFYGAVEGTICSILLSILPISSNKYQEKQPSLPRGDTDAVENKSKATLLLHTLLKCLHEIGGFNYMECTLNELEHDADNIIKLLAAAGSEFGELVEQLKNYEHSTILQWVKEALDFVYTQSNGNESSEENIQTEEVEANNKVCMIIALITQWLVRFMCKKLMQLMTPEALILKRKIIPVSYLETYLNFQSHFSLNELLSNHIHLIEYCDGNKIATKLICYTRSNPLIHQLPEAYPRPAYSTAEEIETSKKCIETLIFDQADCLFLCKLSEISSETSFKLRLQFFKDSTKHTVFVLVIDMKEADHQTINHIRSMIEGVAISRESKKLYVLLLHFPSTMLYETCYPALFLFGWDHYYLDTLKQFKQTPNTDTSDTHKTDTDSADKAANTVDTDATNKQRPGINGTDKVAAVDIRKWLKQSCLLTKEMTPSALAIEDDPMCKHLLSLLKEPESIQVIASRILLKMDSDPETLPNITAKYDYLKKILFDKQIGKFLCLKFRSYWKPSVIGSHLEKAASFARNRESTLSVSDSVDSMYKTTFFNFIAYMIYKISNSHGLELLFSSHCDSATWDLFLKLLVVQPIPRLFEIKAFNNTWDCRPTARNKISYIPWFPFFGEVSSYIDTLIYQTIEKSNKDSPSVQEEDESSDVATGLLNKEKIMKNLYKSVHDDIANSLKEENIVYSVDSNVREKEMIATAVKEMQNDKTIWKKYHSDFICQYLHIPAAPDSVEHKLLQLILDDAIGSYSEMRAIALHCYIHLYQLNLAKLIAILKPLGQLKVGRDVGSEQYLIASYQKSKSVQGSNIFRFVIDSLFTAFTEILSDKGTVLPHIQQWYGCYRELMSLNLVKNLLPTILADRCLKTKYHMMETVFVILQMSDHISDVIADCVCTIARDFNQKFFASDFQPKSNVPLNLENMYRWFSLAIQSQNIDENLKKRICGNIMDVLFTQFLSKSSTLPYVQEDVKFLVKFANDDLSSMKLDAEKCDNYCLSLVKMKFHLENVLSRGWSKDAQSAKPLNVYKIEVRICIGEAMMSKYQDDIPSIYVPPHFQGSKKPLMQQKLAHLYYYTVLERMQTTHYTPITIMTSLKLLDEKLTETKSNEEKLVLYIERQAIAEILIQTIADSYYRDDKKIEQKNLLDVSDDVNHFVEDQTHYDILLMHLIKKFHGPRGVLHLLSEENKEWWNLFNGFKYVKEHLKDLSTTNHLFPFVLSSVNDQFSKLYKEICDCFRAISESSSTKPKRSFLTIVKNSDRSFNDKKLSRSCIRMMIWLCVYYEYFCKKKCSPQLISLFENTRSDLKFSDGDINLLKCFLEPTLMIKKELSVPTSDSTGASQMKRKLSGITFKEDAIWELFNPENEDLSDTDLRHALANMIGVAFALPNRSNHIWYHMFWPGQLENTYLTGFMYPNRVKKGGLMYDCGCELDEDGQYGRKDYIPHATRGTLSLHSWYLMLWTNFGAFCVGLLTQPNAVEQIRGRILSNQMSIRDYCMTQLRTVWQHMRTNMGFNDDERSFFIMRSMHTLFMMSQDRNLPFSEGKLTTIEQLNEYEKSWHKCIYQPSKSSVQVEMEVHSVWKLPVLQNYRILNQQYPHLATENEYMKNLVAAREAHNLDDAPFFALHLFTLEYERLQLGGVLLPDLVEFYQWIHTHLSHLVTYEKAQQFTIGQVISLSAKRYSQELCDHLTDLFKRIIEIYNAYLKLNGGSIDRSNNRDSAPVHISNIDENTLLINLISHDSGDIAKTDWIYIVVMDIIKVHNLFLSSVSDHAKLSNCHYRKYLPENLTEIYVTEVTTQSCIVPYEEDNGKQQFLKLIKSCYMYNGDQSSPKFDLEQLEQNVVAFYIAGKSLITSDDIRIVFRFRDSPTETNLGNSPGCAIDISSIAQELPSKFKEPLQESTIKSLKFHFRSATYQILNDIVVGLRAVLGYVNQDILKQDEKLWESKINDSLVAFLSTHFSNCEDQKQLFYEIGIQSISDVQLAIFRDLEIKRLFRCMELFVGWLQGGLYDFSNLPVSVFKQMDSKDVEFLERILDECPSTEKEYLLAKLDKLEKTLNSSETDITKRDSMKSIAKALEKMNRKAEFITLVPKSVLICHYVEFRMTLRRIRLKMMISSNSQPQNSMASTKWTEIIEDFWKPFKNKDQLYDENYLKYDCIKLQFQIDDGEESDSDSESWLHPVSSDAEEAEAPLEMKSDIPEENDKGKQMTHQEVCNWLREKKVPDDVVKLFEQDEGIDGEEFFTYGLEELEDIGVAQMHIRKRILRQRDKDFGTPK